LQLQSRLDAWGREHYQQAQQGAPLLVTTLHQQSLEMAQLLLDDQGRQYPLPAGAPVTLTQAQREQLDRSITARFELLLGQYPAQAGELNRVRSSYRFVRAQLLGDEMFRAKGGADFYIARNISDLDEMAMQVMLSPTASR
jgi:lauroyl/myristoyl acyltransferase